MKELHRANSRLRVAILLAAVIGSASLDYGGAAAYGAQPVGDRERPAEMRVVAPSLSIDHAAAGRAFRIAMGDLLGNVQLFQDGLLERPAPVILAGLDYGTPWTRDASINAWNGASLIIPDVSRNTLFSVVDRTDGKVRIGGQYWDAVVWTTGAWHHYLYTGDRQFLAVALEATTNSLDFFERTEFDAHDGLFRGPGWSDGVAAYPDKYGDSGGSSAILDWPKHHPDCVSKPGYGIPMKALSTNCLYFNAYVTADRMARELAVPVDPAWHEKASRLRKAINDRLWVEQQGNYRFFIGPFGPCDHQEGLGASYAVLFGVADPGQAESIFRTQYVTPAGLPCGWPNLPRYVRADGMSFGRHMGTVWPQIQGFWAEAAARAGKPQIFGHEFFNLAEHAARDLQFAEIYHPLTGEKYGGLQERGEQGVVLWEATSRQTWAATSYLRMVLLGLIGLRFDTDGVRFQPCLPQGVTWVQLRNLRYRGMTLDVTVQGTGAMARQCLINGQDSPERFLSAEATGPRQVTILLGE